MRTPVLLRILLPLLLLTPACASFRAVGHPEVARCLSEGAPLVVVVDRADAAERTSKEVERLLTATPTNEDWPKQLHLSDEQVHQIQTDQAARLIYDGNPYDVLPSVVWANALPNIKNEAGTDPLLLAAISPEIGEGYATLVQTMASVDLIHKQIADEEKAKNAPDVSDADKKAHEDNIAAKKIELDKAKAAIEPAQQAFIASCKALAAKATPDVQARFGDALVNLHQALDDAEIANGCAVVKYPFVIPNIKDQVLLSAKANLTDYVYEQTGKHLKIKHLQVGATYDGEKVGVQVSGMTPEDLGKIDMGDLITETISRTEQFAIKSLVLLATTSSTEDRLDFESSVVGAILDGFKSAGWSATVSAYVPLQSAIAIQAGTPAPPRSSGPFGGLLSGLDAGASKDAEATKKTNQ